MSNAVCTMSEFNSLLGGPRRLSVFDEHDLKLLAQKQARAELARRESVARELVAHEAMFDAVGW